MQGEGENTSKMSRIYTNAVQTSDYRTMLSNFVQGHQLGPLNLYMYNIFEPMYCVLDTQDLGIIQ